MDIFKIVIRNGQAGKNNDTASQKMHSHPSVPKNRNLAPSSLWSKSTKKYGTKEIVQINFMQMKHGGSRWGENNWSTKYI